MVEMDAYSLLEERHGRLTLVLDLLSQGRGEYMGVGEGHLWLRDC